MCYLTSQRQRWTLSCHKVHYNPDNQVHGSRKQRGALPGSQWADPPLWNISDRMSAFLKRKVNKTLGLLHLPRENQDNFNKLSILLINQDPQITALVSWKVTCVISMLCRQERKTENDRRPGLAFFWLAKSDPKLACSKLFTLHWTKLQMFPGWIPETDI